MPLTNLRGVHRSMIQEDRTSFFIVDPCMSYAFPGDMSCIKYSSPVAAIGFLG